MSSHARGRNGASSGGDGGDDGNDDRTAHRRGSLVNDRDAKRPRRRRGLRSGNGDDSGDDSGDDVVGNTAQGAPDGAGGGNAEPRNAPMVVVDVDAVADGSGAQPGVPGMRLLQRVRAVGGGGGGGGGGGDVIDRAVALARRARGGRDGAPGAAAVGAAAGGGVVEAQGAAGGNADGAAGGGGAAVGGANDGRAVAGGGAGGDGRGGGGGGNNGGGAVAGAVGGGGPPIRRPWFHFPYNGFPHVNQLNRRRPPLLLPVPSGAAPAPAAIMRDAWVTMTTGLVAPNPDTNDLPCMLPYVPRDPSIPDGVCHLMRAARSIRALVCGWLTQTERGQMAQTCRGFRHLAWLTVEVINIIDLPPGQADALIKRLCDRCPQVTSVHLRRSSVPSASLLHMRNWKLACLRVHTEPALREVEMMQLVQVQPMLRYLYVSGCEGLQPGFLQHVTPQLTSFAAKNMAHWHEQDHGWLRLLPQDLEALWLPAGTPTNLLSRFTNMSKLSLFQPMSEHLGDVPPAVTYLHMRSFQVADPVAVLAHLSPQSALRRNVVRWKSGRVEGDVPVLQVEVDDKPYDGHIQMPQG